MRARWGRMVGLIGLATAIALAGTAFSASVAGAQARPAVATVATAPAQVMLLAATSQETAGQPQEVCGPPGTPCGSVAYLESGKFNFYDSKGQHIEGGVTKAEQGCSVGLIAPYLILTIFPLGGWELVTTIVVSCVAGGVIKITGG